MEWLSAVELASRIRKEELTALECVNFFVDRIERLDRRFNLVVVRLFEAARTRAKEADAAARQGCFWGPLHGVPMTVKESFSIQGVPTTCGIDRLRDHRPKQHAVVVEKLLAAGAIIIGKTNVPVLAADFQSYNPIYGCSNNPWDVERSPGGSSGGAAGALAAGFTPLEVGSDIGGSIRGPAHCCGVVGIKPTFGVVDSAGHVPPAPFVQTSGNLAVVGPMARCCQDLALALEVLAGPPKHLQAGWVLKLPPPRASTAQQLRVAVCSEDADFCPVDAEIAAAIRDAATSLSTAGAEVDYDARPDFGFREAFAAYIQLLTAESDGIRAKISYGHYLKNADFRLKVKEAWARFFERHDVFLCPVASTTALLHDHSEPQVARTIQVNGMEVPYVSWIMWSGLIIFADLPVTVVPVGQTATGLPIGVQIVAPAFHDRTSIQVGALLEECHRRFKPPPSLEMAKL